jgi:hypothetical protein
VFVTSVQKRSLKYESRTWTCCYVSETDITQFCCFINLLSSGYQFTISCLCSCLEWHRPLTERTSFQDPSSLKRRKFFSSPKRPGWLWEPNRLQFGEHKVPLLWEKRPGSGADHSTASSTELKNEWSHTTVFLIRLLDVETENFAFIFPLSVRFKVDLWLDLRSEAGFLSPWRGTYKHTAEYHGGPIVE